MILPHSQKPVRNQDEMKTNAAVGAAATVVTTAKAVVKTRAAAEAAAPAAAFVLISSWFILVSSWFHPGFHPGGAGHYAETVWF